MNLTARQFARAKPCTEFHALDRGNRNDRCGDFAVQPAIPLDMAAQPRHQAGRCDFEATAQSVAGSFSRQNQRFLRRHLGRTTDREDLRTDGHSAQLQQLPAQRTNRDSRSCFARAGPFQNIAYIAAVIFLTTAKVGMAGAGRCNRRPRLLAKRRHFRLPVHPVRIGDTQGNRAAQRLAEAHPG